MEEENLIIAQEVGRNILQTTINLVGLETIRLLIQKSFPRHEVIIGKGGELNFAVQPEKETIKRLLVVLLESVIDAFGYPATQQILLNVYQTLKEKYGQDYPLKDLLDLVVPSLLELNPRVEAKI